LGRSQGEPFQAPAEEPRLKTFVTPFLQTQLTAPCTPSKDAPNTMTSHSFHKGATLPELTKGEN